MQGWKSSLWGRRNLDIYHLLKKSAFELRISDRVLYTRCTRLWLGHGCCGSPYDVDITVESKESQKLVPKVHVTTRYRLCNDWFDSFPIMKLTSPSHGAVLPILVGHSMLPSILVNLLSAFLSISFFTASFVHAPTNVGQWKTYIHSQNAYRAVLVLFPPTLVYSSTISL